MNSVDTFVRTNILSFPNQFPNRTAILHHALCAIGSGYEWSEDGTLIYTSAWPSSLWNREEKLAELEAEKNENYASPFVKFFALAEMKKDFKLCAKVVEEVETRMHERTPIKNFHSQSNYALLMNIPENVTQEWQEACDEMKDLAQKAGWAF